MTPWTHAFWWASLITAVVFLGMGIRGVWFLRTRPEFVFSRREAYLTAFWLLAGLTVTLSLVNPHPSVDPGIALGRCGAALSSMILAWGLWTEEKKLLEWPTPREITSKLDTQADIEALRELVQRFGARPYVREREARG